jgi:hypothetical protein
MRIISAKIEVRMSSEEAKVICKMIGPTSAGSRKVDFNLTEKETNIAESIYNDLSIVAIGEDNDE